MKTEMSRIILAVVVALVVASSAGARTLSPELEAGTTIRTEVAPEDFNFLLDYAGKPSAEEAGKVFDIIKSADAEGLLRDIRPDDDLVVFLSVGGLNQIVYIREYSSFIRARYADPAKVDLYTRVIYAVWVTDNADNFTTSVEVDITALTHSVRLTSFESQSPYERAAYAKDNRELQVGIKGFYIPQLLRSVTVKFIRRDLDTYEIRTWSRTFRAQKIALLGLPYVWPAVGLFVPISDSKISHYEVRSDTITHSEVEPIAYLVICFRYHKRYSAPNNIIKILNRMPPDLVFGVALPTNLDKPFNRSILAGFGWPVGSDILKLSIGAEFRNYKLRSDYRVGDNVANLPDQSSVYEHDIKFVAGLIVSIEFISGLFR
jgi:hypothetical protein